ncbi:MAG: MarR family winged helix-turn-helix transcriptional regulator [Solirubrobacteraceae bacterium]
MDVRTASPPAGAEDFLVAFETLAQAVRRARGAAAQDAQDRLTLSQYSLLMPLSGSDTARVSDLAAGAGIAPSTASRILDALERRAIVRRTRSQEDRRGVTVSLTEHGREALDQQHEWMRGRQLEFFDGLAGEEREIVSDLLVRLANLIDELSCGPGD